MKLFGALLALGPVLAAASNVIDLTPKNFDEVVLKGGKPAMVEFFAPWCGHCKKLAPIWEELADSYASKKDDITIAKVDCDANKKLCQRFGIQGYPSLRYFDGKSDTPKNYDSQRDLGSLQTFISEQSSVKAKAKKEAPSAVTVLNDDNFSDVVGGDKHVLVEFYAPWCGHCKQLAPIYERLANTFVRDSDNVVIAKIDADAPNGKASAQKYGVSGFPTLKFFPKGSTEPLEYKSGRTEEAFVNYLNEHAGTFRLPGGRLNEHAGLIPEFQEVVKKVVKGDTEGLSTASKEILKLAKASAKITAPVYVKIFEKLASNEEYIEKELARLGRILSKGGLVPEKAEELTVKKNILSSFFNDTTREAKKDEGKDEL